MPTVTVGFWVLAKASDCCLLVEDDGAPTLTINISDDLVATRRLLERRLYQTDFRPVGNSNVHSQQRSTGFAVYKQNSCIMPVRIGPIGDLLASGEDFNIILYGRWHSGTHRHGDLVLHRLYASEYNKLTELDNYLHHVARLPVRIVSSLARVSYIYTVPEHQRLDVLNLMRNIATNASEDEESTDRVCVTKVERQDVRPAIILETKWRVGQKSIC